MAAIKSLDESAAKWQRRAAVAGEDYKTGVSNPRTGWQAASLAAEPNYKTGVTAAANAGRYGGGVRRAGDAKWKENAIAKGPDRFIQGVQLSTGAWQRGFGPHQAAIGNLTLPARGPTGSPQNLQRVAAVDKTLNDLKNAQKGGR